MNKVNDAHHHALAYQKIKKMHPWDLSDRLELKLQQIHKKHCDNLTLEEHIKELEAELHELKKPKMKNMKSDGKTYSADTRMCFFYYIASNVAMKQIPHLMKQSHYHAGYNVEEVLERTCIEDIAHQVVEAAELEAAEVLEATEHVTLGFDSMTQEGVHVNCQVLTTCNESYAFAIDELAGGMAKDYLGHICEVIDKLTCVWVTFHDDDLGKEWQTMTDHEVSGFIDFSNAVVMYF